MWGGLYRCGVRVSSGGAVRPVDMGRGLDGESIEGGEEGGKEGGREHDKASTTSYGAKVRNPRGGEKMYILKVERVCSKRDGQRTWHRVRGMKGATKLLKEMVKGKEPSRPNASARESVQLDLRRVCAEPRAEVENVLCTKVHTDAISTWHTFSISICTKLRCLMLCNTPVFYKTTTRRNNRSVGLFPSPPFFTDNARICTPHTVFRPSCLHQNPLCTRPLLPNSDAYKSPFSTKASSPISHQSLRHKAKFAHRITRPQPRSLLRS